MSLTDNPSYKKQRRYPRFSLRGLDIHAHVITIEEVDLQNISINGACIQSKMDLQPGRTLLLTLGNDKMSRSLRCTTVWMRAREHGHFVAGLQFQNLSSDEIVRVKDFMRNFGTPVGTRISDEYKPSPLRYSITRNTKAFLKCPRVLNVRTISLCGMLMESDYAPEMGSYYIMGLPLPRESKYVTIRGRIASIQPRIKNDISYYDVGVEFLSMEASDRLRLDTFIRSL